ncbi:TetR/AcrR family transcriptional regulator, partial [Rhodococcus hoagii]|nr:TetR/AcrR family transcriptional regulator [Prescottella equi]
EQDVRRMRELAHLSASTTVAALVRDRRRVRSARAAAEELD